MGTEVQQAPGTQPHPGFLKRIMSRVRSSNDIHDPHHCHLHHNDHHHHHHHQGHNQQQQQNHRSYSYSTTQREPRRRNPSFKNSFSGGSASNSTSTSSDNNSRGHSRQNSLSIRAGASQSYPSPNPRISHEAPLSRDLWEQSYDSLRLDPSTSSLVVTYESIISQELPDDLKSVAHSTLSSADGDKDWRMELMSAIVSAKLNKRRGSKASQTSEMPRVVLEHSKKTVEGVWDEFPSAALAWAGICTLTPLLIDPILRHPEFYKGMVHIIGRIPWYMHLTHLLQCPTWHDADDFAARQEEFRHRRSQCRDAVLRLYKRVLEFEMNCVCATASAWNSVARHTVRWNALGELNEKIREADARVRELVMEHVVETTKREKMLALERDMDVDALERERSREEKTIEEVEEAEERRAEAEAAAAAAASQSRRSW